jgi:hypothetical protein
MDVMTASTSSQAMSKRDAGRCSHMYPITCTIMLSRATTLKNVFAALFVASSTLVERVRVASKLLRAREYFLLVALAS